MKRTEYIIGTSGWNYADWEKIFYPEDLPKKDWLNYYEQYFSVVEINSTFYRLFKRSVFENWKEKANKDFKYIIKVNRLITHVSYLKNCGDLIKNFCQSVNILEDKLALILLQLPPRIVYDPLRLKEALLSFNDPKKVVIEFRDKKWFTPEIKKMMTEIGCVFCAVDSPTIQLLDWVTSDIAYIRLHGHTKWYDYNYTYYQLRKIAAFAKKLAKKKAKKIYILFNNDYYSYAVKNALYLKRLLDK